MYRALKSALFLFSSNIRRMDHSLFVPCVIVFLTIVSMAVFSASMMSTVIFQRLAHSKAPNFDNIFFHMQGNQLKALGGFVICLLQISLYCVMGTIVDHSVSSYSYVIILYISFLSNNYFMNRATQSIRHLMPWNSIVCR